jgi:hypothetical protein
MRLSQKLLRYRCEVGSQEQGLFFLWLQSPSHYRCQISTIVGGHSYYRVMSQIPLRRYRCLKER